MNLFVAADGDHIGALVGRARLQDDVGEIRRVDQAIRRGNDLLTAWAVNVLGSTVEAGGDEVLLEVPAEAVAGLEDVRRQYAAATGATLSVGVGSKPSEASKALEAAKLRGRDRTVLYGADVEEEIQRIKENPSEAEKIAQEYLAPFAKSDANGTGHQPPQHPATHQPQGKDHDLAALVDGFHKAAHRQAQADQAVQAREQTDVDGVRQQVAGALQSIQQQLPALQQVKSAFPQTYQAVVDLANATLALARAAEQAADGLSKAEKLPRIYRAGDLRVPSLDHPDRQAWDAGIRRSLEARWANGGRLTETLADLHPLDLGDPSTLDPRRVALYREMLANGDAPPPVVVDHDGAVLQGRHAAAAFRAEGRDAVPALVRAPLAEVEPDPAQAVPGGAGLSKGELPEFLRVCPDCGSKVTHKDGKLKEHLPKGSDLRTSPGPKPCSGSGKDADKLSKGDRNTGLGDVARAKVMAPIGDPIHHRGEQVVSSEPVVVTNAGIPETMHVVKTSSKYLHRHGPNGKEFAAAGRILLAFDPDGKMPVGGFYHIQEPGGPKMLQSAYVDDDFRGGKATSILMAHAKSDGVTAAAGPASDAGAALAARHGLPMGKSDDLDKVDVAAVQHGVSSVAPAVIAHAAPVVASAWSAFRAKAKRGVAKAEPGAGPAPDKKPGKPADPKPPKPDATGHLRNAHRGAVLPVGSTVNGEVKVRHQSGKVSWRGVREGMISGTDPTPGLYSQVTHPVSARRPGST